MPTIKVERFYHKKAKLLFKATKYFTDTSLAFLKSVQDHSHQRSQ